MGIRCDTTVIVFDVQAMERLNITENGDELLAHLVHTRFAEAQIFGTNNRR